MKRPLRVLIVEDNPSDVELVLLELRRANFDVSWRHACTEGEYLEHLQPELDIILSDYDMPSFSGPQALILLQQSGLDIPFIIISGTIGEDVAVEVMRLGASDYLLKDRLARLGIAISHAIEQGRLRRESKKVTESLRQSEERFRQLAENIQEVFWITDPSKQQVLYISPAYEAVWSRTCESLYASPESWMEVIHAEDRDHVRSASLKQAGGTYNEQYRIMRPDGMIRWIRDRAFPVFDASGEVYRIVGVATDITAIKLADERLHEQASLLDRARDAIIVRDLEHHITYWNKGAERLYGWSEEEAMGKRIPELLYRDTAAFEEGTAVVIRHGEWHGELQQHSKTGGQMLVEARWTLVSDSAGRPQSILAINTDITEKKKLEQQFLRAQRLESIGTLAGGIAHDLNNVLAPILMSIELLRLTSQDERAKSMLATIEASTRRGADMVRQILSFARGAEGRLMSIDPRHTIKDIQHLVQETFPKNIQLQCDLAADLRPITSDHTQLHQVLLNLCVNARDSMPSGGTLTISASNLTVDDLMASMHPHAKPGPHVRIKVSDTGTGIPPEVMDKIFDPFFTTKEVGKGTGLGLSTALAIVKNHGGFLEVESKTGGGTTFSIYLPSEMPAGSRKAEEQDHAHPHGHGELILVVDDEAAVRMITKQTLEAFGYRAIVAADGTEALSLYTQHQPEVAAVITDLMMPVMDGAVTIQVMQRINPAVKIIAGSGITTDGTATRMTDLGVKHFLAKPYTAQAMLAALHQLLSNGHP